MYRLPVIMASFDDARAAIGANSKIRSVYVSCLLLALIRQRGCMQRVGGGVLTASRPTTRSGELSLLSVCRSLAFVACLLPAACCLLFERERSYLIVVLRPPPILLLTGTKFFEVPWARHDTRRRAAERHWTGLAVRGLRQP